MYILATTKHIRIKQLKHTILHDYYLILLLSDKPF